MTPVVKAKLDSILRYPFLGAAGRPLPANVSKVDTWLSAANTCGFIKWKNSQLQARNALQRGITDQFPKLGMWERLQEWNPLVDELDSLIDPFVEDLMLRIPLKGKGLKNVNDSIRWDLGLICLETYYQDIVKPIFYVPCLEPWYAAGHFPCGWDGDEFPEQWDGVMRGGQLIVF